MEYYGNNDWRDYLRERNELMHFGIPKRSGGYPWGSGENPYHHGASAPGGRRRRKYQYTDADLQRIKKASSRGTMLGGPLGGIIGGSISARRIRKEAERNGITNLVPDEDVEKIRDKQKNGREYTDEELKRIEKAASRGTMLGGPLGGVIAGSVSARNIRKEAKAEQKVATKENQDNFTGKQQDASNIVDKYHNNVESLSEADYKKLRDTSKEIRNKGERATNAEWALEKQANTILENRIANEVKRAKEKDNYDFNFLEAIQNKQIIENEHEAERLKAYEEYLRDPEGFWDKLDKYKDL